MRSAVQKRLEGAILRELKKLLGSAERLDCELDSFFGVMGFRLGKLGSRSIFVSIVPHDQQDSFRCHVVWNESRVYPSSLCRDLRKSFREIWALDSGEVNLADMGGISPLYDYEIDPRMTESRVAQEQISQRLSNGEDVSEEEWIATLSSPTPAKSLNAEIDSIAGSLARDICSAFSREFGRFPS